MSPLSEVEGRATGAAENIVNNQNITIKPLLKRPTPYIAAALTLFTLAALWLYYQQGQPPVVVPPHPSTIADLPIAPASQPAIVDTVNQLPAPAAGSPAPPADRAKKPWTEPAAKPERHKTTPKLQLSRHQNQLETAWQALAAGRLEQAEQDYQAVLTQYPREKDALLGLAVIAQRQQKNELATELYRQVLREDLGNAAAAAGLVSLSLHADPLAAESQLHELIDLKPNAAEFHYALGGVLAHQQRWGEAQQAYFRAYSLNPARALYAYNLAVVLDRLHQRAEARSYYEKSAQLDNEPTLDRTAIARRIQELQDSRH